MPKKLKLIFSFTFPAKIWNLLIDQRAAVLYLELRDEEKQQASFAAYALKGHQLLWEGQCFEENWWIGMSAADAGGLVMHTYDSSENPEEKSFFVLDSHSQQVVWQAPAFQVLGIHGSILFGFSKKEGSAHYQRIALGTQQQQSLSPQELEELLAIVSAENKYIRRPFHYTEDDTYFSTVSRFVQNYLNLKPRLVCEYLEYGPHMFISYYVDEDQALANYLLVINQEGDLRLHEKLDDHLPNPGLGTFMCVHDQLIFIKQKRALLSYAI